MGSVAHVGPMANWIWGTELIANHMYRWIVKSVVKETMSLYTLTKMINWLFSIYWKKLSTFHNCSVLEALFSVMSLIGTPNTLDNALRSHVAFFFLSLARSRRWPRMWGLRCCRSPTLPTPGRSRWSQQGSAGRRPKPSPDGNNLGHTLLQSSARLKSLQKLKLWQFCFLGIAPFFVKNLINEHIDTDICLIGYQREFWHCR